MKKTKKVKLLEVQAGASVKLQWKVNRQIQQELLQKKLMQCLSMPGEGNACIKLYPMAMQPMIRDFMRKADEQTRLSRT